MRGWEARGQSGAHDPERGEPREPVRDAPVERGDGVDLSVAVLDRRDLHAADGMSKRWYLEEDLGCRLRLAALRHELDRAMEVGLATGEALGERQRVASFHQDVQAPALDLGPLAPFDLGCLDPVAHGASVRLPRDEPSRAKVGALPTHFGQSGELTGARAEALARTREPARRVLALRLDRVRELLGRGVRVAGRAAGDRPFELLHLPPLHVREARLDPPCGFGFFALDLLPERPLAAAQPLVELVERAPPLAPPALELGR